MGKFNTKGELFVCCCRWCCRAQHKSQFYVRGDENALENWSIEYCEWFYFIMNNAKMPARKSNTDNERIHGLVPEIGNGIDFNFRGRNEKFPFSFNAIKMDDLSPFVSKNKRRYSDRIINQFFYHVKCLSIGFFCVLIFYFLFSQLSRSSFGLHILKIWGFGIRQMFHYIFPRHIISNIKRKWRQERASESIKIFFTSFLFGYSILFPPTSTSNNNSLQNGLFCKNDFAFVWESTVSFTHFPPFKFATEYSEPS